MMGGVTVSIESPRRPPTCGRSLEPVERHVDWMADAVAIRFESEQARGVGTTFLCDTKIGPIRLMDRMEITEWRSPARRRWVSGTRGIVTGTGVFTIEPLAGRHTHPLHVDRAARLSLVPRRPDRRGRRRSTRARTDLAPQPEAPEDPRRVTVNRSLRRALRASATALDSRRKRGMTVTRRAGWGGAASQSIDIGPTSTWADASSDC